MKTSIVVLDDYERSAERFTDWSLIRSKADVVFHQSALKDDALVSAIVNAEVLVLIRDRTPITRVLLNQLPRLKYLVFTGGRNGLIDMAALAERGIPVSCTAFGPSKEATAELTIALLLSAFKRLDLMLQTAGRTWRPSNPAFNDDDFVMPRLVSGATLGLVGLGAIGTKVAVVAKALGMQVQAWSPNLTDERALAAGVKRVSFEDLLRSSDAVSLHLVLAASTQQIINAERLATMRPNAFLINTSRSGLVDEKALIAALKSKQIAGAAIDVFDSEPVPQGYVLTSTPNLISTPHLGFVCEPVYENFWMGVNEALSAWLTGASLPRVYEPSH